MHIRSFESWSRLKRKARQELQEVKPDHVEVESKDGNYDWVRDKFNVEFVGDDIKFQPEHFLAFNWRHHGVIGRFFMTSPMEDLQFFFTFTPGSLWYKTTWVFVFFFVTGVEIIFRWCLPVIMCKHTKLYSILIYKGLVFSTIFGYLNFFIILKALKYN